MEKKLRPFALDAEVYNSLSALSEECGEEENISLFVNNCLKELSAFIQRANAEFRGREEYGASVSALIKTIGETNGILTISTNPPAELSSLLKGGSCISVCE